MLQFSSRSFSSINRPLRSVLFTPGSRLKALQKCAQIPADAFIFDLEDAVSPDAKEVARTNVVNNLHLGLETKKTIGVRINGLDTPWGYTDLQSLGQMAQKPHAIVIPKVESAETIRRICDILSDKLDSTNIWACIETPLGIINVEQIAQSHEKLECLVMGTSDLTKDLHAEHTLCRTPLLYSLSKCVVAARAFGLKILDGVYLDFNDPVGFEKICIQARSMGFDGKTLIHPSTVEKANEIFAPSPTQVENARKIIEVYNEAIQKGSGVAILDGKLIENLHVKDALRLIQLHEMIHNNK